MMLASGARGVEFDSLIILNFCLKELNKVSFEREKNWHLDMRSSGTKVKSDFWNQILMMLKAISNFLICVQCSAGFAIFTHKDSRYSLRFEEAYKMLRISLGSGMYFTRSYPVNKNCHGRRAPWKYVHLCWLYTTHRLNCVIKFVFKAVLAQYVFCTKVFVSVNAGCSSDM